MTKEPFTDNFKSPISHHDKSEDFFPHDVNKVGLENALISTKYQGFPKVQKWIIRPIVEFLGRITCGPALSTVLLTSPMRHRVRIIHGVLNYFLAAALVINPLFFPFEESMAANLTLTIAGLASLCLALVSDYELGLIKSIRYKDNLLINAILGSMLMISPFLFGFSELGLAQHLVFGFLQIVLPLGVYKLHSSKKRTAHLEFH